MDAMTPDEILKALPHRRPMLLVDGVREIDPSRSIVAYKRLPAGDDCFDGHFPGRPVMPGVLIIEALAQAAALLAHASMPRAAGQAAGLPWLLGVDNARFHRPVVPGADLELWVERGKAWGGFCRLRARAQVSGQVVAEAMLLAALLPAEAAADPVQAVDRTELAC